MNKIRVIDLLNKIANGEEVPEEIKVGEYVFHYDITDDNEFYRYITMTNDLITDIVYLNDEVEIIEEPQEHKIPEKWQHWYNPKAIEDFKLARFNSNDMKEICKTIGFLMEHTNTIKTKLDEIIDYLKENR